jgi:O-antigen/teichoic acid export membrane protein
MLPERLLFADGAVYAVVEVIQQGLGFVALPLFLFFLDAKEFGAVTWGVTVAQVAAGVATLGLEFSVMRLYWRWPESERTRILARIAAVALAWSALGGIAASLAIWHLAPTGLRTPIVLGVWAGAALGVRSIALSVVRVRGPIRQYARLVLTGAGLQTAIGLLLVWIGWKATGYLAGYAFGAIFTVAPALRELGPWRSWWTGGLRLPKDVVTYTVHTFPANMINRLAAVADRLVLGSIGSIDTLGLYGVAARFTVPVRFMSGVFKMTLGPSLSRSEASGAVDAIFRRLSSLVTILMLLSGSVVALAVWFVRVTPWAPAQGALQRIALILLLAEFLAAMTSLGQLRLYYSSSPKDASIAAIGSVAALVTLLMVLVPHFGGNGAAAAKILASVIGVAAVIAVSARRPEGRHGWARLGLLVGSFIPALLATYLLGAVGQIVVFATMALGYGAIAWMRLAPLWRPRALALVR